jgi:protease-4
MLPLYRGVLQGMKFEEAAEPYGYKPRLVAVGDGKFVNVIHLSGTMLKNDGDCGEIGTVHTAQRLHEGDILDKVIGHILVIDSGGGSSMAARQITNDISKLTKPVVAFVDGLACSAAYRAAAACSRIISADSNNMVGCIGTFIEIQGLPKRATLEDGEIYARIYADQASEKNADYEDALAGDFKLIKEGMLNPFNQEFMDYIRDHRLSVRDDQLHGRTYLAKDVVGTLVDSIGTEDDAIAAVVDLAKTSSINSNSNMDKPTNANSQQAADTVPVTAQTPAPVTTAPPSAPAATLDARIATLEADLASANETIATRDAALKTANETIATRDARIKELETALDPDPDPAATEPIAAPKTSDGNTPSDAGFAPEDSRKTIESVLGLIN